MTFFKVTFCCLLCLYSLSCRTGTGATVSDGKSRKVVPEYEVTEMATLESGIVKMRATIESLKEAPNESLKEAPNNLNGQIPQVKLVIRNLSDGKIIYEDATGNCTLYAPGFWIDQGQALIETCEGSSGGSVSVLEVTESNAHVVLSELFRAGTVILPSDKLGGQISFIVLNNDSGSEPLQAKRYQYNKEKKRYILTGTVDFATLIDSINHEFKRATK